MIIVTSQLIILGLTIIFTAIALFAIYKYEANFYIKTINIKDSTLVWFFVTNVESYNTWWDLFKNSTTPTEIKILKNIELNQFKIYVRPNNKNAQLWTFYLNLHENKLTIKSQILTNNYLFYFLAKDYLNSKLIKNYIKNLENMVLNYNLNKAKKLNN